MKITKVELIELNACKSGLARFIAQTGNTELPVDVASLVGGENTNNDLLWLAIKFIPRDRIVRFACDCALINLELIKPYTDKYKIIEEFLKTPTTAADAARAAADAAADAARAAADAAADAARAAADAAAWAARAAYAAWAAWAARDAARAAWAARDAARAAAADANSLLIAMFNEVE